MSSMIFGCVSTSRSLQPLRSRGESGKRPPRNAASSSLCCWIMVPIAPSRMTMRWPNNSRRRCALSGVFKTAASGTGHLAFDVRAHAEGVADREGKLGAVQRIEMKLVDAMPLQHVHLLDRHGGRDHLAGLGVVLEPVEAMLEPLRDGRAATLGEARDLREARDRQDAGHDGRMDAARRALVTEAQEHLRVVEELRDGARSTRIDLALQVVEIELGARRLGMFLGIRGHRNLEVGHAAQA